MLRDSGRNYRATRASICHRPKGAGEDNNTRQGKHLREHATRLTGQGEFEKRFGAGTRKLRKLLDNAPRAAGDETMDPIEAMQVSRGEL